MNSFLVMISPDLNIEWETGRSQSDECLEYDCVVCTTYPTLSLKAGNTKSSVTVNRSIDSTWLFQINSSYQQSVMYVFQGFSYLESHPTNGLGFQHRGPVLVIRAHHLSEDQLKCGAHIDQIKLSIKLWALISSASSVDNFTEGYSISAWRRMVVQTHPL